MTWYIYGVLLWIVAIIHAICLPDPSKEDNAKQNIVLLNAQGTSEIPEEIDINANALVEQTIFSMNDNQVFVNCNIRNLSLDKTIVAVKASGKMLNSFDNEIVVNGNSETGVLLQDLNIMPGETGKNRIEVLLPDNEIRKLNLHIDQIKYSDGTIWNNNTSHMVPTCQNRLSEKYLEYAKKYSSKARYHSAIKTDYWQCVCGFANRIESNSCPFCGFEKRNAEIFDLSNIDTNYESYQESKRLKAEEAKKANKKKMTMGLIASAVFAMVIIIILAMPKIKNQIAKRYIEAGNYDKAISLLETMDIDDSQTSLLFRSVHLKKGFSLLEKGECEEAAEEFKQISTNIFSALDGIEYKYPHDVVEDLLRVDDSNDVKALAYEFANQLAQNEYEKAIETYDLLGDYEDCKEKATNLKYEFILRYKDYITYGNRSILERYLNELSEINYKDSNKILEDLFG